MQYHILNQLNQLPEGLIVIGFLDDDLNTLKVALPKDCHPIIDAFASNKLSRDHQHITNHNGQTYLWRSLGQSKDFVESQLLSSLKKITNAFKALAFDDVTMILPFIKTKHANWQIEKTILFLESFFYQYHDLKTTAVTYATNRIHLYHPAGDSSTIASALSIASGVNLTKQLGNMPANLCTPSYLASVALSLAKAYPDLRVTVHDKEAVQKIGMNTFLSVAKGSDEPLQFIELHYKPALTKNTQPIVLIGKGITFDSGGINIKPSPGMEEMKFDMGGAASVLGTFKAIADLKLPVHVIGFIPACENMPSGKALKPGDVIKSLSGQTIEVINTDAEGRLILCDALTFASQFKPKFVIDIATLTGAVIIALGNLYTGFMTEDPLLAEKILTASKESLDKAWQLPLDKEYQEALESPVADMVNATFDRVAGSIIGGTFLSRFAKDFPWAHLDIAGAAWISGKNRDATGRPVPLLVELLRDEASH
jgi:leucyl aminopeptidase